MSGRKALINNGKVNTVGIKNKDEKEKKKGD